MADKKSREVVVLGVESNHRGTDWGLIALTEDDKRYAVTEEEYSRLEAGLIRKQLPALDFTQVLYEAYSDGSPIIDKDETSEKSIEDEFKAELDGTTYTREEEVGVYVQLRKEGMAEAGDIEALNSFGSKELATISRFRRLYNHYFGGNGKSVGDISVKIDVDVSEALTGLKAVQREAKEATKALRELEAQIKINSALPSGGLRPSLRTSEQDGEIKVDIKRDYRRVEYGEKE